MKRAGKTIAPEEEVASTSIFTSPNTQLSTKMLPPIDDSILQGNPKFAALHTQLTNSFLNPNGSTKHHPTQKERDAVSSVCNPSKSTPPLQI
jgi:hypothetical protein